MKVTPGWYTFRDSYIMHIITVGECRRDSYYIPVRAHMRRQRGNAEDRAWVYREGSIYRSELLRPKKPSHHMMLSYMKWLTLERPDG